MNKTFIFIVGLLISVVFSGSANAQVYRQGDGILSVGIGFGLASGTIGGLGDLGGGFGPISLGYEAIVSDSRSGSFGVGALVGARLGTGVLSANRFTIMGRAAYHFNVSREFDLYAGLGLGVHIQTWKLELLGMSTSESTTSFAYGLFFGGRYYISDAMALYAELGYGVTFVNIGLAFKF